MSQFPLKMCLSKYTLVSNWSANEEVNLQNSKVGENVSTIYY